MRINKAAMVRVLHDEPKFSEMFMWYYWPAMPEPTGREHVRFAP
jgi:hypothetical protein